MKGNSLKACLLSLFLTLQVFAAFGQNDVIDMIRETLKAGSSKELSRYLNQTVDVTIEGKVESYSKPQAEFVFRDFFKQHPPSDFSIIHQGSSQGGKPFAIGQINDYLFKNRTANFIKWFYGSAAVCFK